MPLLKFVIPVLFACAVVFGADENPSAGENSGVAKPAPQTDVTPLIQKARDEWQAAQKIEQRIREGKPSDDYIQLLNQAEAHYNKAIEIYTQAIVASKNNPIVLSDLGRLCLSRQDRVQARKFLGAAILHNNNLKMFSPSEEADLQRTLGGLLERAGVVNLAMDRYKRAFELNASDIRNRLSLATAHIATGSPQDAIDLLEAVCAALPGKDSQVPMQQNISALALYTLALGREEIGQPEEALATYRLAAERCSAPELAPDWGVTERAEAAVARLEDAFDALAETAKAREKENEERARRNLPPLPNDRESYAKAARWTTEGVKIRQQALSDKEFLEALAALRAQGETSGREKLAEAASWSDYQLSMDYFQRAASAFPRFSRAYYELGVSSMMLNRPGPARKLMEEAVVCNPNSVAALNLYGDVLLQLGQWAEAQRIFKRLRSLDPESARANLGWARATSALKSDLKSILQAKDALDRSEQLGAAHDEYLLKELNETEALLRSGKRPPEPPKIRSKAARRSGEDRERQPNFNFWNQGGY